MKIGIVGAGTMGMGVAQVFAQAEGYEVALCSSSLASAQRGMDKLSRRLAGRVAKGKLTQQALDGILSRIHVGELEDCADCELVIECIKEDMAEKKRLFARLTEICREDCVFASNTSSLSITEMFAGIRQPGIGMHFYNPAPVMKLIEVIAGLNTPEETVKKIVRISTELGKCPVEVKESAGFVVNRMLIPMINEAIAIYAEGIASIEGIDMAMRLGANHPMGPLQLGDFIGLDVCLAILEVLQAETGDSKYRPHPLLRKMVRGGQLGVKTGQGFYHYDNA